MAKMGMLTDRNSGLKTYNGDQIDVNKGFFIRHRTPGTTEAPGRRTRRNKSTIRTKDSQPDSNTNTIMDITRQGVSEYDTTARTGSQGQGTVRSYRAK